MKALVTGASSGIGHDIATELYKRGFDLILVGRNKEKLIALNKKLGGKNKIITADLSIPEKCVKLYEDTKNENIDVLINNAGFGVFGEFTTTSLDKEIEMINVNINAVHILMKLFLKDFAKKNSGYILNVASSAAFLPGPLLASYYATKAYVLRLTQAVDKEIKKSGINVHLSALCPGPVQTNFNNRAGVKFAIKGLMSQKVAKYAVSKMFKGQTVIIPGLSIKAGILIAKFLPVNLLEEFAYNFQTKKRL